MMYEDQLISDSCDSDLSEIERELEEMEVLTLKSPRNTKSHRQEGFGDLRRSTSSNNSFPNSSPVVPRFGPRAPNGSPPDVLQYRVGELEKMMEHLKLQPTVIETRSESRSSTPRKLHLVTQETATEDDRLIDLRSENDRLLETLSLVNEKNRKLRDQVDLLSSNITDLTKQVETLKMTVAELENQRKIDQGTITRLQVSSVVDASRLDTHENLSNPAVAWKAVTPPWATHEDLEDNFPPPHKSLTPPSMQLDKSSAAPPMTARLESDLLKLNLERQQLESALGRIPPATATIAELKQSEENLKRLDHLERSISEIKAKIRARKLRNSRTNISIIRY